MILASTLPSPTPNILALSFVTSAWLGALAWTVSLRKSWSDVMTFGRVLAT